MEVPCFVQNSLSLLFFQFRIGYGILNVNHTRFCLLIGWSLPVDIKWPILIGWPVHSVIPIGRWLSGRLRLLLPGKFFGFQFEKSISVLIREDLETKQGKLG